LESLIFCNRTLGYVNAPALFQKAIADSLDADIDVESYKQRRDLIYDTLTRLGFSCIKPQGTFYIFPKSPIEDDIQFIKHAVKYNILLVPGTGFGLPGHFRLSYCVSMDTIKKYSLIRFVVEFFPYRAPIIVGAPYGTAAVAGYYSPLWNYVRTDSEIWTKTLRWRGPSNSIKKMPCQVPNESLPW